MLNRSPDIVLPALETIQKAEKLVSRLVAPWPAVVAECLGKGLLDSFPDAEADGRSQDYLYPAAHI